MAHRKSPSFAEMAPSRTAQHCAQCTAHGKIALLKGHKKICPYKDCTCVHCVLVINKRQIMAKQVKLKRLQEKNAKRGRLQARSQSRVGEAIPFSSPNNFGNLNYNQDGTWRAMSVGGFEQALDGGLSNVGSLPEQWCPVSPMQYTHVNPLQLQPTSHLIPHYSPPNSSLFGVPDQDYVPLNHVLTQPVFFPQATYTTTSNLTQTSQFPGNELESFPQAVEVSPSSSDGNPQSIDAAQTLLTLRTGEE